MRVSLVEIEPKLPAFAAIPKGASEPIGGFAAGAALASLHPFLARPHEAIPLALIRDRRALVAAQNTLRLIGRRESTQDIRDAVGFLRPGESAGPAGEMFAHWRAATQAGWRAEYWEEISGGAFARWSGKGVMDPLNCARGALNEMLTQAPDREFAALITAEAVLCKLLGWERVVPLIAPSIRTLDVSEGISQTAICRAILTSARDTMAMVQELIRRQARLLEIAPKLRNKSAPAALDLFLSQDCLSPNIALSPVVRGSRSKMTDRSARRLCDRLVELGVLRELTGRENFRLYGL